MIGLFFTINANPGLVAILILGVFIFGPAYAINFLLYVNVFNGVLGNPDKIPKFFTISEMLMWVLPIIFLLIFLTTMGDRATDFFPIIFTSIIGMLVGLRIMMLIYGLQNAKSQLQQKWLLIGFFSPIGAILYSKISKLSLAEEEKYNTKSKDKHN